MEIVNKIWLYLLKAIAGINKLYQKNCITKTKYYEIDIL